MTRPHIPRRPMKREAPMPGLVSGVLVIIGAWIAGWWIVAIAALIVTLFWWHRADIAQQALWGAVGGWIVLLLVDSIHGRTWALARAAGGVVFLPWGLLIPVTLLFAAGLAWSTAVIVQALCTTLADRNEA